MFMCRCVDRRSWRMYITSKLLEVIIEASTQMFCFLRPEGTPTGDGKCSIHMLFLLNHLSCFIISILESQIVQDCLYNFMHSAPVNALKRPMYENISALKKTARSIEIEYNQICAIMLYASICVYCFPWEQRNKHVPSFAYTRYNNLH